VTGGPGDLDATWSPDGTRLALGRMSTDHSEQRPIVIQIADLRSGKASPIPGSEGRRSPRWSPDGRSIAALSADATGLALYELETGRWRDLLVGADLLEYPSWTRDGTRIQLVKGDSIVRVHVASGTVEPVASLSGITRAYSEFGTWLGIAPDDAPIALRAMSGTGEVYALDVEWP